MAGEAIKSQSEMTPERWEHVREVAYAALQQEPSGRSTYLDQACASDGELRSQVESLMATAESAERALPSGIFSSSLLPAGTKIDEFEIISLLGAGGMGEVYRARDTQLRRDVAIKVLPSGFSENPDRLRRFEQEARAAAALNHPNILAIHHLGRHEGQPYIVSELLEGQTLREELKNGALPMRKAGAYAIQIAGGLAAAHGRGVVHRDLKPENIFVASSGQVKILDFGLAKLWQTELLGRKAFSSPVTQAGLILGTVGYMSPEQVRGQPTDERADVFVFGAVLYEMFTGERAFRGATTADVISAILVGDPLESPADGRRLRPPLQRILRRCLEKEPAARFQSGQDVCSALETLSHESRRKIQFQLYKSPGRRTAAQFLLAALGLVAVSIVILFSLKNAPHERWNTTPTLLTANLGETRVLGSAISRDGNYLAYVDSKGLSILAIASGEVRLLRPEQDWDIADWFPDGTKLLASRKSELWSISTLTGAPKLFRDHSWGARFSPDGSLIAFAAGYPEREIWIMRADTQFAHQVAQVDSPDYFVHFSWAPDGQHLVDIRERLVEGRRVPLLEVRNLKDEKSVPIVSNARLMGRSGETGMVWLNDGNILYLMREDPPNQNNDNLWRVRVDQGTGVMRGKPERITNWAGLHVNNLSASLDGRKLAFVGLRSLDSVYVARLGANDGQKLSGLQKLTNDNWNNWAEAWSPDSTTLFYKSERQGNWGIFKQDIHQKTSETLASGTDSYSWFDLSPDGAWLLADAYNPYPTVGRLMRIPVAGGKPEVVFSGPSIKHQCASLPANFCVLAEYNNKEVSFSLLDPNKGRGEHLLTLALTVVPFFPDYYWSLSRDGKHIAVVHRIEHAIQIIDIATRSVRAVRLAEGRYVMSVSWSADSRNLFVSVASEDSKGSGAILYLDLHGKEQELLVTKGAHPYCPVASPDGRMLAFTERIVENNAEMIERF